MSGILPVHTYLTRPKLSKLEELLMEELRKSKDIDDQNVLIELASDLGMRELVTKMHQHVLLEK